jgi:hypothetical protein
VADEQARLSVKGDGVRLLEQRCGIWMHKPNMLTSYNVALRPEGRPL